MEKSSFSRVMFRVCRLVRLLEKRCSVSRGLTVSTNNILVTYGALQVLYCIVLYLTTCSMILDMRDRLETGW